jgi:hypothetical protein
MSLIPPSESVAQICTLSPNPIARIEKVMFSNQEWQMAAPLSSFQDPGIAM